jgi:monofunctional glycosyltransferase
MQALLIRCIYEAHHPWGSIMASKKRKKAKPTPFKKRLIRLLSVTIATLIALTVAVVLPFRWLPPPTTAFMVKERLSGSAIDYHWVPMSRISPYAALAVIASEDQNFFNHWGIDLKAVADAIEDNRSRKIPRGASTISQQVVKNLFLWPGHSYVRKAIEVYATVVVEVLWPKQRILEVYLNIAEMGSGVFGVEAAGRRFFHQAAADLSQREAAILAAVLPNPKQMLARQPSDYVRHRSIQIVEQMMALGGLPFLRQGLSET